MFCVGLTGGIGSGKSTVAEFFKALGVTIIDADNIAHRITESNTYSFESIAEHFGNAIVKSDGTLDRKMLRDIIFQHPAERQWLENLLHPVIREAMKERIVKADSVYCLLVIPLLAETNKIDYLDRICVIDTPQEQQINRVMKRDNISSDKVKEILASQCSSEERLKISDDVIYNDGDIEKLHEQVRELNRLYLELAGK